MEENADIKVLYVEDAKSSGGPLRQTLKDADMDVTFVGGGFDALDELRENGADIVVACVDLNDLSGYQLAALIKSSEATQKMPVVLFAAHGAKVDDFWVKASLADVFYGESDLSQSDLIVDRVKNLVSLAREKGYRADHGKAVVVSAHGFSSKDLVSSCSHLLDDLLLERSVGRLSQSLAQHSASKDDFLENFFLKVAEYFNSDLFGIVVAASENPWATIKISSEVSSSSYKNLLGKLGEQLELKSDLKIEVRGESHDGPSREFKSVQILPIQEEGQGLGALIFASLKDGFSESALAFMNILRQELRPVLELLLARQAVEDMRSREAYRASIDSLTGLYNLEFLVGFLQQQLLFSFRQRLPVALAIIDLDQFSEVNKELGYEFGDGALMMVANRLLHVTRSSDLIARYGGDQFAVVLPNTDVSGAKVLGEKVRSEIEMIDFAQESGKKVPKITVSVGCASFNMEDLNPETILRDAKIALKKAKEQGRNRVSSS